MSVYIIYIVYTIFALLNQVKNQIDKKKARTIFPKLAEWFSVRNGSHRPGPRRGELMKVRIAYAALLAVCHQYGSPLYTLSWIRPRAN